MHIWTIERWRKYYDDENVRHGLRLKIDKDVDPEVKRACKEFCAWLRKEYYFPIRVPVYIKSSKKVRAPDGDLVYGIFVNFEKKCDEPFVSISTGDYCDLLVQRGKDDALATIISSIAHELTHYFQWLNDIHLTEIGEERQANSYAGFVLYEYSQTREHP